MNTKTLIGHLKTKIEDAEKLKLNYSCGAVVAASLDGVYCIVENGTGINNTCVQIESLTPLIMTATEIGEKIRNTSARNGKGEIKFFPVLLKTYCNMLIKTWQGTIDFMEKNNIDIDIK